MNILSSVLVDYSITEIRSALYYLGRHLKQASFASDYAKDIFDDGSKISPSEEVKTLTVKLLKCIEFHSKKPASEFDDMEFNFWVTKINEIDSSLDPDVTEEKKLNILKKVSDFSVKN